MKTKRIPPISPWLRFTLPGGFIVLAVSALGLAAARCDLAAEKKAAGQVLEAQIAAWNKGDLEGFMTTYWNSPELSFFSGKDKTTGWQATLARYRKRYQAEGREMGHLTFSELDIDMLGSDSAFVRGRWQLETKEESFSGLFTLILKKLPEGWRIVHDHTSA